MIEAYKVEQYSVDDIRECNFCRFNSYVLLPVLYKYKEILLCKSCYDKLMDGTIRQ